MSNNHSHSDEGAAACYKEGDENHPAYAEAIGKALSHNDEMAAQLREGLVPAKGNRLAVDSEPLSLVSLGEYAHDAILTALDISAGLRKMIVRETPDAIEVEAVPAAPFVLARSMLEAAGQAFWILGPTSASQRRIRCFRLLAAELRDAHRHLDEGARHLAGFTAPKLDFAKLEGEIRAAGLDPTGLDKNRVSAQGMWRSPSSSEVMKWCDSVRPGLANLGVLSEGRVTSWFNTWQLCSGFAHGRSWARMMGTDYTYIHESGPWRIRQAAPRVSFLALAVHDATEVVQAALWRYARLSARTDAAWR